MHTFRVWAPLPKSLEISVSGKLFPLASHPDGWWSATIDAATIGDDYGFVLDGQGPFPDPRSAAQPNGVHGLSRLVDHNRFQWTDAGWQSPPLSSAIIYELHIGTFTPRGTFISTIEKLDHLVALGVTHVELMPVVEFGGNRGWGYDGVDLFAPHHAYGTPDELKQLVNACHGRGLGLILDVVYNHLGPSGNYLAKFGPYFTKRYAPSWGEALNFDGPDCQEVRRFFCDNALMWLRNFHFDGLRLDAVHAIYDFSARHILEQLKLEVEQLEAELSRPLFLIAESDLNDPRLLWSRDRGGFNLDAQWSDDFHHALHTVLTGEANGYYADYGKIADLAKALKQAFIYDGKFSSHRRRVHGRAPGSIPGRSFLGYLQNHDQIGNRALGERSNALMSLGKLKIGAALVLTSPFVPMLFQGEEWGAATPFLYFTDYPEPELAAAVHEGRCREFAAFHWDPANVPHPQALETFERSKLNWSEPLTAAHVELLAWHQGLIRLRQSEPALQDNRLENVEVQYDESCRWLILKRGDLKIVCNFSDQPQIISPPGAEWYLLMASQPIVRADDSNWRLPPESVNIIKIQ